MKKIICIALIAVMAIIPVMIFTSCGSQNEGKLVCGITNFEPMNYKENNEWTGFDTEFAKLVGDKLGMRVVFEEIDWEGKYNELESGAISCIWNGFTANCDDKDGQSRGSKVDFSYGYMLNQQCVIVKKTNAENFKSEEDLKGKDIAAESGSAGETYAKKAKGEGTGDIIAVPAQINTFTEVKSGAVDCAVVDILLAQKLVDQGDFSDLVIADITLESEIYAIGFKKGSDLTEKVNKAIEDLFNDGSLERLAAKYHLENVLKLDKDTEF